MKPENVTKKFFKEIIEEVQNVCDYQEGLNRFFEKNDVDGYLYQPDCVCATIKLLHMIFEEKDREEWISYFCFELDFGRKYKEGEVLNKNGTPIQLATIDDLYDLLTI